ncbi:Copper amine oxidase [Trema orientale]|uniref:Amine oxidase n=1 Tax=Trema orientale TaxID=63057 RepID=A0A2P5F545_TREOI|nr:Copper amine oxidase [Trema orientale]
MVISRAMVWDSETRELRNVMYKGLASELFVPYMDVDECWYFKKYRDAGEFGPGVSSTSLVPLNDCPSWRHSETFLPGFQFQVRLSGMLMAKRTPYENVYKIQNQEEIMSGLLVSENFIGVVHDHFVTFRFDIDIDGPNNSFAKFKLYEPSEFHVINPSKLSRFGNPSGYKLVPGKTAASLLDAFDPPQIRSAFTNNQIWVTPYNRNEQWAGGLLTYQSKGDNTLAVWSEIKGTVQLRIKILCYGTPWDSITYHARRTFPVMPTVSASFDIKPANFFELNPISRVAHAFDNDLPVCNSISSGHNNKCA